MFCDLVGSTALSARLDPEDMREIIGTYHRCCAEQITKAGGFVAKYMGDGVLAYFGFPQAHEDDAERAVRTALSLIEAVPSLRTGHDLSLQVRVGIATGVVVVGDLIGEGDAQERGVVGDTPNLAARLQALAEPGQVVIAQSTRRLTGGHFEYRDLGRVALKGLADPIQAWQVVGASTVESRFEALHGAALTPLVGREEELELLLRRWRQAKAGEGSIVLVSGEPGIGKSRIVEALFEKLRTEPYTRLRLFCSPHHQDTALYPTITQLERAAGFRRDDTDEQRLDKLEAVLAQATNDLKEAAPLLAQLLSVTTEGRYPALDLTPQSRKEKTFKALIAQVAGLAARQPVVMVYEDAHWIDPTSLELLDLIVDRVPSLPVLLIITFRPEFTPSWVGRPQVTLLSLSRLPHRQRSEMLAQLTGGKALPREIADQIVDRTDGVPLFIEELTKAVIESGDLADAGDHYKVTRSLSPLAIPTTLHASLMARLDRLASVREVAQIGAAVGRRFSHELISAVVSMPQKQLDDGLAQLVNAELLFRRGTPPDAEYTFKHALVQDAAYSTLLRGRRQQLHARIAETLERQFPEIVATEPASLAQHWTEAASVKEAIAYWSKATRTSLTRSAMVEAAAQARKGLDLLLSLIEDPERWRQELELQTMLGWALFASKGEGAPEAGEAFIRARDLCDHLGDRSSLGRVLSLQGSHYLARAQHAAARHAAEELLQVALERNDAALEVHAHQILGRSLHWLGAVASAVDHFERALSVRVPETGDQSIDGSRAATLSYLAYDLMLLGHVDQAVARRGQALALARQTNRPYVLAVALIWAGLVDALRGAEQSALECNIEIMAIAKEQSFALVLAGANLGFATGLSRSGKTVEGLALARQAFAYVAATGFTSGQTQGLALLGYCCERAGEIDEALSLLDTGLEMANATDERFFEAELHRLKGEWLAEHRGAHLEAAGCYQRALAVARQQEAKLFELRASTSLARLRRDQGKLTEARDLLAPIYGWFTEGFDTPDLKEAKALLEELA
ncbi:MAG TPA: AAA family ATPase [Stellaceae bacterium]|nr:AAA family ATPase [Stellaceae bacterium]